MPKLIRKNPKIQFNYNFTELHGDYIRAYHGLADVHEYFQLNLKKFANGYFKGKLKTLKIYQSQSYVHQAKS